MPDLYTSLTRLKMALNGGQMPPMTPIPEGAQGIIDPSFTPGLGALHEDPALGLRCPVRDCGRYMHQLGVHIAHHHRSIGGVAAVKRLLDIPKSVGLISTVARDMAGAKMRRQRRTDPRLATAKEVLASAREQARRRSPSMGARSRATMAERNLRDRCIAQLSHRLIDTTHRIGRVPTADEYITFHGQAEAGEIRRTFGTWNNFLAQCGVAGRGYRKQIALSDVLDSLAAWYAVHGELPSSHAANLGNVTPLLPNYKTILSVFDAASWTEAMRQAAALLSIQGGRYGLPVKQSAEVA